MFTLSFTAMQQMKCNVQNWRNNEQVGVTTVIKLIWVKRCAPIANYLLVTSDCTMLMSFDPSRSFKVIDFCTNRKPMWCTVYDFLLVIRPIRRCDLSRISHRFQDWSIALLRRKAHYPMATILHLAPHFFRISWQTYDAKSDTITSVVFSQYTGITDDDRLSSVQFSWMCKMWLTKTQPYITETWDNNNIQWKWWSRYSQLTAAMYQLVNVTEQLPFIKVSNIAFNCSIKFMAPGPRLYIWLLVIR